VSDREVLTADGAPAAAAAYSHAVRHGGVLYCSGQIALDPESGKLVGENAAEQAERCLRNLEAVCGASGTGLNRALRLTIYTTAMEDFAQINEVYAGFFVDAPPARAAVGVTSLPRGAAVMIDAIVAVGAS